MDLRLRIFLGFICLQLAGLVHLRYGAGAPPRPEMTALASATADACELADIMHSMVVELRYRDAARGFAGATLAGLEMPELPDHLKRYRTSAGMVHRPGSAPLGVRYRNYWNVKRPVSGGDWQGVVGYDRRGHAVFDDPAFGVRAAITVLRTYQFRYGLMSVESIISRWAPLSDGNPTRYYVNRVAHSLGVSPNAPLKLFDRNGHIRDTRLLRRLLDSMAAVECGANFQLCDEEFSRGLALYHS